MHPLRPRRPLGGTGLLVSPLGLAGFSVRGPGPSPGSLGPDDVERAFHAHGVNTGFPVPMTAGECYRFVLAHPMVDLVWCGARTAAELIDDLEAAAAPPLGAEHRAEICRFGDAVHRSARYGERWMFGPGAN